MKLLPPMEWKAGIPEFPGCPITNNYKNINRVSGKAYNSAYMGCSSNQTTEQSQAKRSSKEIYLYQQTTWVHDTKPTLLHDWRSVHMADHRHALWREHGMFLLPSTRGHGEARESTLYTVRRMTSFIPCLHFPASSTPSGMN